MTDFFVTLPSNGSIEIFPENKTSEFTVKLAKKVNVSETCKLALSEIHFPYNFHNVTQGNNGITLQFENGFELQLTVKCGYYKHIIDLIEVVEEMIATCPLLQFEGERKLMEYNSLNSSVKLLNLPTKLVYLKKEEQAKIFEFKHDIIVKNNNRQVLEYRISPKNFLGKANETYYENYENNFLKGIYLENRLSMQLGFPAGQNISTFSTSPFPLKLNAGIPDQLFIYCDILDYQFVGNTYSKVLKIITIDQDKEKLFGSNISRSFIPLQYLPLEVREFDQIKIVIKDGQGKNLPFLYGTLIAQLHFKDD
jgi:hypothetical protein